MAFRYFIGRHHFRHALVLERQRRFIAVHPAVQLAYLGIPTVVLGAVHQLGQTFAHLCIAGIVIQNGIGNMARDDAG